MNKLQAHSSESTKASSGGSAGKEDKSSDDEGAVDGSSSVGDIEEGLQSVLACLDAGSKDSNRDDHMDEDDDHEEGEDKQGSGDSDNE